MNLERGVEIKKTQQAQMVSRFLQLCTFKDGKINGLERCLGGKKSTGFDDELLVGMRKKEEGKVFSSNSAWCDGDVIGQTLILFTKPTNPRGVRGRCDGALGSQNVEFERVQRGC